MATETDLHELYEEWEDLRRRGQPCSAADFCRARARPELAGPLDDLRAKLVPFEQCCKTVDQDRVETVELPAPAADTFPEVLADSTFRNLVFFAQGGLGRLYQARDAKLDRDVVLKFMKPELLADRQRAGRFVLEAEVTGQLDHPGVVPIYALGRTADGRPFYAMRLVRGRTLQSAIDAYHRGEGPPAARRTEFHDLLRHFVSVCKTLAYAHDRGVLHCDVKPQNVMVGKYGETLVLDWGEATGTDVATAARTEGPLPAVSPSADPDKSPSSSGGGTLLYMSPERLAQGPIDRTADVYSLGVTLYRLLTGKDAFAAANWHAVADKIRKGECARPSAVRQDVPPPLEAVCRKAMALEPGARYASAEHLAADVEHWLNDDPVTAYRESRLERVARWTRRHRGLTQTLAALLIVGLLTSALLAVWQARAASREQLLREAANAARLKNLQASARFAARSVGYEIELRWRVLEREAAAAPVPELLRTVATERAALKDPSQITPAQQELMAWLARARERNYKVLKPAHWFITDAEGTQVARSPPARSVNENFRYRDYFHGLGHDLDPEEARARQTPPLERPHVSNVYASTNDQDLMVSVAVPIHATGDAGAAPGPVLGVLAMIVRLAEFESLDTPLADGRKAVLVDTEPEAVQPPAVARRGLVLHHPKLALLRFRHPNIAGELKYYVADELTGELTRFRANRLAQENVLLQLREGGRALPEGEPLGLYRTDYADPVEAGQTGPWWAAFEPVFIRDHREGRIVDTGWVALVQESPPGGTSVP